MLIDDLTLILPLGKGAFGEVYLTSKQGSKEKFATKRIAKKYMDNNPKVKKYLDNVIQILKEIDHPNLIKLYEVKETSDYLYLVREFCNGGDLSDQLEDYLKKYNHPFTEDIVQNLMKQIISGIQYLHEKIIIHCNLK